MSALMLLRGLSFSTRNICSSLSKDMKFPNQERFASLSGRGWLEVGREGAKGMKSPLRPLFPSLSDSLWRGLWRQTGHLLGSGDWGGESMVNTCPSSWCPAHRPAVSSNQRFQIPESIHFPAAKPQTAQA